MSSGRCWIFFALALTGAPVVSGTSLPALIDGSVSGDLFPFEQTKTSIHWVATATTDAAGERTLSLEAWGPGVTAAAIVGLDATDQAGTWNLRSAEVDAAQWWGSIAARYFPDGAGLSATGKVSAAGKGTITESKYSGMLRFNLAGGSLADLAGTWSVSALSGELACPDFPAWTTSIPQRLSFGELMVAGLSLKNGMVDYQLESGGRIRVHRIQVQALGGTIKCGEFVVDSTNSPIEAVVRAEGIELNTLQSYLPKAVAEAHGQVDLQLRIRWSVETGFEFGYGTLQLKAGANASLRLAPSPGFLTSKVPARIELAPSWMGRLGRAFSQAFPARQTLESIENGREALMVDSIEAELNPADQDTDATAILRIVAHPIKTDVVKKVRLNIKIAGPLADVVRYGMDDRVSFTP